jgi:hypothetical protein
VNVCAAFCVSSFFVSIHQCKSLEQKAAALSEALISAFRNACVIWPSKTDYLAAICSFRKQILWRSDYT